MNSLRHAVRTTLRPYVRRVADTDYSTRVHEAQQVYERGMNDAHQHYLTSSRSASDQEILTREIRSIGAAFEEIIHSARTDCDIRKDGAGR